MIYFDNAATTRPHDEAIQEAVRIMSEGYANPSALHTFGAAADRVLLSSRKTIASIIGAKADEIYFTSGGTEGNNIAILGAASAKKREGKRIIISAVEHASVDNTARALERDGFEAIAAPSKDGIVELDALSELLTPDTILVSVMLVNNELGSINDIKAIKTLMQKKSPKALLHCDAVQGFLKVKFTTKTLPADLITLSAHKIHAPKGTGAIYIRKGTRINPVTYGGGQESDMRSGTQNVPGIAAFALAAKMGWDRFDERAAHAAEIKARLTERLSQRDDIHINSPEASSPFILNISTPVMSETMLHYLESFDIYISVGSACSSKHKSKSILSKAGFSDDRYKTGIRISIGDYNTTEEADELSSRIIDGADTLIHAVKH